MFLSSRRLSDLYLNKALEGLRAEEYERALIELDRALEASPEYPDLHNFRGIALCELERFDESIDAFRHSAELSPGNLGPWLNLAFTQLAAGHRATARRPSQPTSSAEMMTRSCRRSPALGPEPCVYERS